MGSPRHSLHINTDDMHDPAGAMNFNPAPQPSALAPTPPKADSYLAGLSQYKNYAYALAGLASLGAMAFGGLKLYGMFNGSGAKAAPGVSNTVMPQLQSFTRHPK